MKVHAVLDVDLGAAASAARAAEALGYDGIWTIETTHDPFLPLALATDATERIQLGTGIAVAFPRSPLHLAQLAYDLHGFSDGRFMLGLGSQVRAHVERRFSAAWSRPVARMRELILAVRAIWAAWHEGAALDFRGDFYTHTLMTPFFNPGPSPAGLPPIVLAGVGSRMTEVAGEVADGLLVHGFTTERYLREHMVPALERGLSRSGRTRADVEIVRPVFLVTGATEEERAAADHRVRERVAFYAATVAYRPVLECHGWENLQDELIPLGRKGEWATMGSLIDDEVLNEFAIVGDLDEVPTLILDRYGDLVDRVSFSAPYEDEPEVWGHLVARLQQRSSP